MFRVFRCLVCMLSLRAVPGWWDQKQPPTETSPSWRSDPKGFAWWVYNETIHGNHTFDDFFTWTPTSWDGWIWTFFDAIFSAVGWLIFGRNWTQVRSSFSFLLRLGTLLLVCISVHYILALCWPIVSLLVGCLLTLVWLVRNVVRCCGRTAFYYQRWSGGVPEALGASFFGPEIGDPPETGDLRRLKKGSDGEKWVLVRRQGLTAIFRVQDSSSIKSSGVFLTIEPGTMRGDQELTHSLQGHDRVHLCRHESCSEEGPHFKQYATVKAFNPETFQLDAASAGAHQAGSHLFSWVRRGASKAAQKAKDLASESEPEVCKCHAHQIRWESDQGPHVLSDGICKEVGVDVRLLEEDVPVSLGTVTLCPKHVSKYLTSRFQLKCAMAECFRVGCGTSGGLRLCAAHEEASRMSSRRSSTSRSRSRPRERAEGDPEEVERDGGVRRRVRHARPEEEPAAEKAEQLMEDVRLAAESQPGGRTRRRHSEEMSPGRTPKSAVQRSLAKLGMIDSPDRREMITTLEEFMAQFVDGKELGLDEEDIRQQMAATSGMTLYDFTQVLYDQAVEEQRKGTKGLTKFLAKWRKQLAAGKVALSAPTPPGSWSMVSSPDEVKPRGVGEEMRSEVGTPSASSRGLVPLAPPGIYSADDRKAGTGGVADSSMTDIAKAIQYQTAELASLVKSQNEANPTGNNGSIKSLNKVSEELVFLLRACGQYTVEVGENEYGANLANALLAAQAGASTKLRNAGFRQKVTNCLAVGLAGPFWGTQEKYALSAADFLPCTDAELDQHAVESRTGKQQNEQRPPGPTRYEDWANRVKRQTDVWCLVYGKEWRAAREHAAQVLGEWHLGAPHRWPLQVLCEVWEELHWRFVEELKTELRKIKGLSGRESMTLADLKFYALMPDERGAPPLQLPRTFDLHHPDGWFVSEVLPRIERRQERMLWKLTWEGAAKSRGPSQTAGGDGKPDDKVTLRTLLGPKLTTEESNRARDRAPTTKDGKLLCWGYLSHLGCTQAGCQRAHEHLKGAFESLDPMVQMQLLRRGGLRRMRQETKETATEKIGQLRAQVAKDRKDKIKDGQPKRKAGQEDASQPVENQEGACEKRAGGVTWKPPAEMVEVDYTVQEKEFAEMLEGPKQEAFKNQHMEGVTHAGRGGETAPGAAQELLRKAQALSDGPVLGKLQEASDDLYAWAATRVASEPSVTLTELLEDMVQYGLGELAAEAAGILEEVSEVKAGSAKRCVVHDTLWTDAGPGRAQVDIDGRAWAMYDYKEEVAMTEELAGLLGVVSPEVEKRHCVTKVLAAGYLASETATGQLPTMEDVEVQAQAFRLEQARLATEAEGVMGHAEPRVAAIEHEPRMYTHDILKPHHDKDYRALAVFPLEALEEYRIIVLRTDYKGDYVPEIVQGTHWKAGQKDVWALIYKGHMMLLVPPGETEAMAILKEFDIHTTPTLGFRYFWHQRHDQPRTAPGQLMCRHCKPPKRAGTAEGIPMVRKRSCLAAAALCLAGGHQEQYHVRQVATPHGPTGLVLREYFAGHGVITQGWRKAGEIALEPVELYEDPHHRQGPRPDHDLANPTVQQRFYQEVEEDKTNVEWLACPCTTFCDWNLQNHGTRTFQNPQGKPNAKEELGNTLAEFEATLFEKALDRGHFPIAESSGRSGRYPKMWHLPCWQKLLQRPDVDFLEVDMCAYGLAPLDATDDTQFYRHRTGLAFPRHPAFRAALFRLCPGLSDNHQHVPLQGCRQNSSVTRCTEAGVYAEQFVEAVVEALRAVVVGGGRLQPQRQAGGQVQSVKGLGAGVGPNQFDGYSSGSSDEEGDGDGGPPDDQSDRGSGQQEAFEGGESEEPVRDESTTPTSVADSPAADSPASATEVEVEVEVEVEESDGSPRSEEEGTLHADHGEADLAVNGPGGDEMFYNDVTGLIWIWHRAPRRRLVVPGGEGCPFPLEYFKVNRWTRCENADEENPLDVIEIEDNWTTQGACEGPFQRWTGWTVFQIQGYRKPTVFPWDPSEAGSEGQDEGRSQASPREGPPTREGGNTMAGGSGDVHSGLRGGEPSDGPQEGTWRSFSEEGIGEAVKAAAFAYVEVIDEIEDQETSTWRKVTEAGDELLRAAETVERAAIALWIVREKLGRNNLQGVDDPELDGLLHPDHLAYLREIRAKGMPARYEGERRRVRAQPHPRARENLGQVYRQLMKDVAKHRVLVVRADHPGLQNTASSPFEAVPKMLPNRTLSAEVRLVHDQRNVNSGTDKELHPPATQPLHVQVIRRILFWKTIFPKVPILMAKKDVAGAFRLLWVDPKDAELFAGDVPWNPSLMGSGEGMVQEGDPSSLTLIFLVSSFGFSGSPGEWTAWGRGTEELHRGFKPGEPRRDASFNFDGKILVDDMVLVEPQVGLRPWVSSEVYEWAVVKLLGRNAINAAKDAEEGVFSEAQTVWGVTINTLTEKMSLPEARVLKGAHLLAEPQFNFGERSVTLRDLQRLRGIATGWSTIVKGLKNELKAIDRFLGGVDGGAVAGPSGCQSDEEVETAWQDLWAVFEDCRWLCSRSETWSEKFGGDIREALSPMERLALPGGQFSSAVFVSSDATPTVLGAIDWTHGFACREEVKELKP